MTQRHRIVLAALIVYGGVRPFFCLGAEGLFSTASLLESVQEKSAQNATSTPSQSWPPAWQLTPDITMKLRGRVDTDAIWSSQSPANEATFGDLGDVVGLRRARIGTEGDLGDNGRYVWEIDLAPGVVVPRDVYLASGDRKEFGEGQLGHMREPVSFEGATSAKYFAFMERSPVNLLDPARNWGLGLFRENTDDDSTLALGAFHAGTDPGDFQGGDGATVGITGRWTTAPINEDDGQQLLHFGVALSERIPENGVIIVNQQPRSPLLDLGDSSTSPFVPVINIPASFQQLINLQFATASGSVWAQGDWYGSLIDQTGGDLVFFHGFHIDCGWFITGEHRKYDSANGVFGAIKVNRPWIRCPSEHDRPKGCGAWELTARFAYLDFIDNDTPPGPTGQNVGILLPQTTVGVNWYLNDHIRLMFNYSFDVPDESNTGTSECSIFATRLGVWW